MKVELSTPQIRSLLQAAGEVTAGEMDGWTGTEASTLNRAVNRLHQTIAENAEPIGAPVRSPEMTWRDVLIAVTEELRYAPAEALDQPVLVQLPGRQVRLMSLAYDADGADRLLVEPWLIDGEP